MFEQVVDETVEGIAGQALADNFLEKIPTQHLKQTLAPVTLSALLAARALLLEALKLLQHLSYFANA